MINPTPESAVSQPRAMARFRFFLCSGQIATVTRPCQRTKKKTIKYRSKLKTAKINQIGLCHDSERLNGRDTLSPGRHTEATIGQFNALANHQQFPIAPGIGGRSR